MRVTILDDNINEQLLSAQIPGLQRMPIDQKPEVIFIRSTNLKKIQLPESLIAICRAGSGTDNIPVDWCSQHGIVVFNSPGANALSVKELVIWAIITSSRNLISAVKFVEQKFAESPDAPIPEEFWEKSKKKFAGTEASGKRILILGLGAIGRLVAKSCYDLGMTVYGYDPYVDIEDIPDYIKRMASLDYLPECEFVSVHASLTEETKELLGENFFRQCKSGLRLINCARSKIINAWALERALRTEIVQIYISDSVDERLVRIFPERVISLPHIGASTIEAEIRAQTMVAEQFHSFYITGQITNSVNFPTCSLERSRIHQARLLVSNLNKPCMIAKITGLLGNSGFNISGMINKDKKSVGYNIIDIENPDGRIQELVKKIKAMEDVTGVRLIR